MSSDNYWKISRHPRGGYAAVMCFMSNESEREPTENDHRFATWQQAYNYASRDYAEYGISVDPEILLENQDPHAYIMNARAELSALRSDIASELSDTAGDCHLKAAFMTYIDAADLNLARALQ